MPVTAPTLEQDLKLRQLQDLRCLVLIKRTSLLSLMALQRQENFAMANTIKQMLKEWPTASTPKQTIIPVDQL